MTTSTKTRAAKADDPSALLAALEAEAAGIDDAVQAARRAGDAAEYLRLDLRREELPAEIAEARAAAVAAELAPAKARAVELVERLGAIRSEAERERGDLQAERERLERDRHSIAVTDEEALAASAAAIARVKSRQVTIEQRVADAKQEFLEALVELDALEDRARTVSGQRREDGDGVLRLPSWPLHRTVILRHPVTQANVTILAGTPAADIPRWFLAQLDSFDRHFPEPAPHPFVTGALQADAATPNRWDRHHPGTSWTVGQTVATGSHTDRCIDRSGSWPTRPTTPVIERIRQDDGTIATVEYADCDTCGNPTTLRPRPPWGRVINVYTPGKAG